MAPRGQCGAIGLDMPSQEETTHLKQEGEDEEPSFEFQGPSCHARKGINSACASHFFLCDNCELLARLRETRNHSLVFTPV
jgi:hypothetical protein